jgi:hypothetical protein
MRKIIDVTVNCVLVGDYIDESEPPTGLAPQRTENVPTEILPEYLDVGGNTENGEGL